MQKNRGRSGHTVDRLIRELIRTGRDAAPHEVTRSIDRIATAEFDRRTVRIPIVERGIEYDNRRLLPWDDALFAHLVRRVVRDAQWVSGTTTDQYECDLLAAARGGGVRLAVYYRREGESRWWLLPRPSCCQTPDGERAALDSWPSSTPPIAVSSSRAIRCRVRTTFRSPRTHDGFSSTPDRPGNLD